MLPFARRFVNRESLFLFQLTVVSCIGILSGDIKTKDQSVTRIPTHYLVIALITNTCYFAIDIIGFVAAIKEHANCLQVFAFLRTAEFCIEIIYLTATGSFTILMLSLFFSWIVPFLSFFLYSRIKNEEKISINHNFNLINSL